MGFLNIHIIYDFINFNNANEFLMIINKFQWGIILNIKDKKISDFPFQILILKSILVANTDLNCSANWLPISFSPVTSANVEISSQNFFAFNFNPFATLVSSPYLVPVLHY